MRAELTATVPLRQPQYQTSELLVGALSRGYRVVEQPMTMRPRNHGKSKKGNNLVFGANYARVIFGTWARERRARVETKTTRSGHRNPADHVTTYDPK